MIKGFRLPVLLLLLTLPSLIQAQQSAADNVKAGAKTRFEDMDKNHDGFLTPDEFPRPRLFRQADTNGDGKISLSEAEVFYAARSQAKAVSRDVPITPITGFPNATLNIPYDSLPGVDPNLLSLDIYALADKKTAAPVIIMVHGGGWANGDKSHPEIGPEKAHYFNDLGYTYVSVNYRLSPAVIHPAHAQDLAKAIAWVNDHIAKYGGDPARIYLIGHSAGAHLVSLVATDEKYLGALGKKLTLIKGVVALDSAAFVLDGNNNYGPNLLAQYQRAFGTDTSKWRDASPLVHIAPDKGIPPFLIFSTDRGPSISRASEFAAALQKAHIPAAAVDATGRDHSGLNAGIGKAGDGATKLIEEFFSGKNPETFPKSV